MDEALQIATEKIKQLERANSNLVILVDQLQHKLYYTTIAPLKRIEKAWSIIIPRLTFAEQLQLLKTSKSLEKLCLDDVVHKFRVHLQRLNEDNTLYVITVTS